MNQVIVYGKIEISCTCGRKYWFDDLVLRISNGRKLELEFWCEPCDKVICIPIDISKLSTKGVAA